jgi:hypothetical protein
MRDALLDLIQINSRYFWSLVKVPCFPLTVLTDIGYFTIEPFHL